MKRVITPNRKKKILMVANDPFVTQIYQEKFQARGLLAQSASQSEEALRQLQAGGVDLVILDLSLPEMDGIGLLTEIRSQAEYASLPIIVFVSSYLGKQRRAALEAGASECVTKAEVTPEAMLGLVRQHWGEKGASEVRAPSEPGESAAEERLTETLRASAPQRLASLRLCYQAITRAEDSELLLNSLAEMRCAVHPLAGAVNAPTFKKVGQMAGAMEGLLIELHGNPQKITPSVIRTLGQAIDTLAHLIVTQRNPSSVEAKTQRVLVVDDEAISREAICSALRRAGLMPVDLDDPYAAESLLQQEKFDLIFLDVEMPGQSGLELCTSIRAMPINRQTPVVFVTAHSDFGMRAQSTLSGGKDFIAKPFLAVELVVKALTWLFPVDVPAAEPVVDMPALRLA